MIAIETDALVKRYRDGQRDRVVVRDVALSLEERTCTVLMGPSGCGKTTLLSLLGGMVQPTSGDVRLYGESLVRLRDGHRTELRRRRIGFVFQELALVPAMTVRENLVLPWVPLGLPPRAALDTILSYAERVGIADVLDRPARTLSGGERQRAAIVRALAFDAPILLLDEPSAHLDAENAARLVTLLRELHAAGKTIVLSTHDPRLADVGRLCPMRDGRIEELRTAEPTTGDLDAGAATTTKPGDEG